MKYNEITFSEIDIILDNMEDEYVNKILSCKNLHNVV